MAIPRNIREYLQANHISWHRKIHPLAITAQETAQAEHVPGRQFAKTVILTADDRFIMAVLPADTSIRFDKFQTALSCQRVLLASESDFVLKFPGCDRGAMPPFGSLFGMPVFCDKSLAKQFEIEFNGGAHTEIIRMPFSEFDLLENPTILDFAETVQRIRQVRVERAFEAMCESTML
jgi:Ala-tRNA(Pro) deacylase